ncbi:MAG: helical backbone metal receptor [Acidobacteriota bacterium]
MRLISLCPSLTELVVALDRGPQLVGRTRYCNHPAAALETIPTVGGTKGPKIQQIQQLQPSLVLMNAEENRQEDHQALCDLGLDCVVYFPQTVADTLDMVEDLAQRLDRAEAGEALVADIHRAQREATERRDQRAKRGSSPPTFAYLIWRKPWMAVGAPSYVDHLLSIAGGHNVFGEGERYPSIDGPQLAAADPRWVFLSSEPFPFAEQHIEELAELTELPRDRFRLVDGRVLSWHGASTPDGLRYATSLIAGETIES